MEQDFTKNDAGPAQGISAETTRLKFIKRLELAAHFLIVFAVIFFALKSGLTNTNASASSIENLGVQFQSMASEGSSMFFDTNNDPHWLGIYNKITDGSGKTQFFDVNLGTGATRYFNTNKVGRGNGTGKALSGNKLYIGVNDPCYIWEYDISTGGFTQKTISGWAEGVCGSVSSDKVIQSAYTASDGMVYLGTATRGTVIEINPSTGVMRDFGIIDPPSNNPTCSGCASRYVASIAADDNYVYAGMRDTSNNYWWLAIINRADGSLSDSCWKDDGLNAGGVSSSTNGTQIWYTTNGGSYRIDNTNGQCPTSTGSSPSLKRWFYASNVYFPDNDSYANAASVFGVDIDVTDLPADSSTSGLSTIAYRNPAGSGSYIQKTQSIAMMDTLIRRLKSNAGSGVYVIAGSYGPNALYNGSSTSVLGRITNQSTYAVTPIGSYVYLSGYSSTTYRWTPSLPWNLTSSNGTSCNTSSPTNPCLALQALGKYHYYSLAANNGLLYVGVDYARGSRSGGDLAWINPSNNSTGSYAFTCDSPKGLALLADGKTIAYSSESENGSFGCTNTQGKVFIFDTETNTLTRTLAPVSGSSSQGKVIGTKDGGILGVIKDYPSTNSYTLYKVDANGTHASWSPMVVNGNIFSSASAVDQNLVISNDGTVYAWNSSGIVSINPANGSTSLYASVSGVTYIEMSGQDLYIATGANLNRIRGVSPAVSSTKAITAFDFNGLSPAVTGSINEASHSIALTVPFGTNVASITPTITITGSSISPNTGVAKDFTSPVTYTVTAADSSTQSYLVTVNIAGDTTPPANPGSENTNNNPNQNTPVNNETPVKKEVEVVKTPEKVDTKPVVNEKAKNPVGDIVKKNQFTFNKNLKFGMKDESVYQLQVFLNNNGFTISKSGVGSKGKENAYFGIKTKLALKRFQKAMGLKPTGILGPVTQRIISR